MNSNPYREAMELTVKTIERRLRLYRYLVLATHVVGFGSLGTALFLRSWKPLTGLSLAIIFVGVYLRADSAITQSWSREIAARATGGKIDRTAFAQALRHRPGLPTATVEGMLHLVTGPTHD